MDTAGRRHRNSLNRNTPMTISGFSFARNADTLYYPVAASIRSVLPIYRLFDYLAPEGINLDMIKPGVRLEVPFGKGKKTGFLIEISTHSDLSTDKLKPVLRILDDKSLLSAKELRLLQWASHYYHHPLGEVISAAFPTALRQGKALAVKSEKRKRI